MIWATWSEPYFLRHVLDDLSAAVHAEVDVDIGHGDALRVEEALEEELVLERIDVGDLHDVRDEASRRRSRGRGRPGWTARGRSG